jgi:hypothetical protein
MKNMGKKKNFFVFKTFGWIKKIWTIIKIGEVV